MVYQTHGRSQTRLYSVWSSMKQRCYNRKDSSYKYYGARGVIVCDEWHKFEPFYEWAQRTGYARGLTIERDDSDGNYEPSNCKWIPAAEQIKNRRHNGGRPRKHFPVDELTVE